MSNNVQHSFQEVGINLNNPEIVDKHTDPYHDSLPDSPISIDSRDLNSPNCSPSNSSSNSTNNSPPYAESPSDADFPLDAPHISHDAKSDEDYIKDFGLSKCEVLLTRCSVNTFSGESQKKSTEDLRIEPSTSEKSNGDFRIEPSTSKKSNEDFRIEPSTSKKSDEGLRVKPGASKKYIKSLRITSFASKKSGKDLQTVPSTSKKSDEDLRIEYKVFNPHIKLRRVKQSLINHLTRSVPTKNFKVHYGHSYLSELAVVASKHTAKEVNSAELYKEHIISRFNSLQVKPFQELIQKAARVYREEKLDFRCKEAILKIKHCKVVLNPARLSHSRQSMRVLLESVTDEEEILNSRASCENDSGSISPAQNSVLDACDSHNTAQLDERKSLNVGSENISLNADYTGKDGGLIRRISWDENMKSKISCEKESNFGKKRKKKDNDTEKRQKKRKGCDSQTILDNLQHPSPSSNMGQVVVNRQCYSNLWEAVQNNCTVFLDSNIKGFKIAKNISSPYPFVVD